MARINIEDDLESCEEFWRLLEITKDRDAALGKLVRFFRIAQQKFGTEESVSKELLETHGLMCMILSGWAVQYKDGFQAKGCEKHFGWYREIKKKSVKGVEARRKKSESNEIKQVTEPAGNHRSTTGQPQVNPLTLTLTPSLSSVTSENTPHSEKLLTPQGRGKIENQEKSFRYEPLPEEETGAKAPSHWLSELWNSNCGKLPKVSRLSNARMQRIRLRVKEFPDKENWLQVIRFVASDPFHTGQNQRNWRADFDYILQPDRALKIFEKLPKNRPKSNFLDQVKQEIEEQKNAES